MANQTVEDALAEAVAQRDKLNIVIGFLSAQLGVAAPASGAIPAVRLSPRRLRVPRAALEAWLDDQAQRALGDLR